MNDHRSNRPNCGLEEALDFAESLGANDYAFARAAHSTGWDRGRLEAAYDRRYQYWAASCGYDL